MKQHVQRLGSCYYPFQHELKGAEPLLGNPGRQPGSRTDTASSYEQWELAAFRITAPSLGLFSQPTGMTEIGCSLSAHLRGQPMLLHQLIKHL